MVRTREQGAVVSWGRGLFAGATGGLVAAVASVLTRALMHALLPPLVPTIGSAFGAGLAGGLLYAALTRMLARPRRAFWVLVLALATLDSLMIATLPMAAGSIPRAFFPLVGLVVPIRQMAALLGLGQFSVRHFPAMYLPAVTVIHYVTAGAIAWLVPVSARRWAA